MIEPYLADDALLADIRSAAADSGSIRLWWLGQSGFLLQWNNHHLLFDPYLSDALTRKYAETDKPHVRMSRQVIDPKRLDFIDVVTSSHNHTDHLDGETLTALMEANPELAIVVPEANRTFAAERLGVPPERLTGSDVDRPLQVGAFELTAVPAAHEEIDQDEQGRHRYVGYLVRCGAWTVYHSGDTIRYKGMAERLRLAGRIDVALLPINGRAAARRVAGNLWGREAAQLARDIGARCVIPCHYEMFEFNTASPDEFLAAASRLGQPAAVLQLGMRFEMGL